MKKTLCVLLFSFISLVSFGQEATLTHIGCANYITRDIPELGYEFLPGMDAYGELTFDEESCISWWDDIGNEFNPYITPVQDRLNAWAFKYQFEESGLSKMEFDQSFEPQELLVNGMKLHYAEPNQKKIKKKIFILFHGVIGSSLQYKKLQYFLARKGYRSFAVNYSGHGGAAQRDNKPVQLMSLDDFLLDTDTVVNYLKARFGEKVPLIAVGHSWGAFVTQAYASKHPDSFPGIVSLNGGAPNFNAFVFRDYVNRLVLFPSAGIVEFNRSFFPVYFPDQQSIDEYLQYITPAPPLFAIGQALSGGIAFEKRFPGPVLFISDVKDTTVPAKVTGYAEEFYGAQATKRMLRRTNHIGMYLKPQQTAFGILDWLDKLD